MEKDALMFVYLEEEFKNMKDRMINNSRTNADLKPLVKGILSKDEQGNVLKNPKTKKKTVINEHILMIAANDTPLETELLFNYGVTRDEDGDLIPWAKM